MTETIISTTEAARRLGVSPSTVKRLCLAHGIGRIVGPTRALTAADIPKIAAARRPRGPRPKQRKK